LIRSGRPIYLKINPPPSPKFGSKYVTLYIYMYIYKGARNNNVGRFVFFVPRFGRTSLGRPTGFGYTRRFHLRMNCFCHNRHTRTYVNNRRGSFRARNCRERYRPFGTCRGDKQRAAARDARNVFNICTYRERCSQQFPIAGPNLSNAASAFRARTRPILNVRRPLPCTRTSLKRSI